MKKKLKEKNDIIKKFLTKFDEYIKKIIII